MLLFIWTELYKIIVILFLCTRFILISIRDFWNKQKKIKRHFYTKWKISPVFVVLWMSLHFLFVCNFKPSKFNSSDIFGIKDYVNRIYLLCCVVVFSFYFVTFSIFEKKNRRHFHSSVVSFSLLLRESLFFLLLICFIFFMHSILYKQNEYKTGTFKLI